MPMHAATQSIRLHIDFARRLSSSSQASVLLDLTPVTNHSQRTSLCVQQHRDVVSFHLRESIEERSTGGRRKSQGLCLAEKRTGGY
jgi:hypothetical protein